MRSSLSESWQKSYQEINEFSGQSAVVTPVKRHFGDDSYLSTEPLLGEFSNSGTTVSRSGW